MLGQEKGHTLMELCFTLAIMSIVTALAVPGWQFLKERQDAYTAMSRLHSAVQTARHQALSKRTIVTLCPSTDGMKCEEDWNQQLILFTGTLGGSHKLLFTFPAEGKGNIRWSSFQGGKMLRMQENGMTLAQNGTFIYCPPDGDPRLARAMVLNKAGRIRMAMDRNKDGIVKLPSGQPASCT